MKSKSLHTTALVFIYSLFITGCASVKTAQYNPGAFSQIKNWTVELAYTSGSVSNTLKNSETIETQVVQSGNTSRELSLREDLYYYLKDECGILVSEKTSATTGKILVSIDGYLGSNGYSGVTVRLTDSKGEVLSRLKIKNGDRNATFMENERFISYAANAIADEINSQK
jgi:hypothetical protein